MKSETLFESVPRASADIGMVLQMVDANTTRHLRLTHIFKDSVYYMELSNAIGARDARRPSRMSRRQFDQFTKFQGSTLGRIALPQEFSDPLNIGAKASDELQAAWRLIAPLIEAFKIEENLARNRFASLISFRARETNSSATTIRRLVLRFYYFGSVRAGLVSLTRGRQRGDGYAEEQIRSLEGRPPKRRGPKPRIAKSLGDNDFIVSDDDIVDMVSCLKRMLRKGPTQKTEAHEEYLKTEFRRRHKERYKAYVEGECPEPVTYRQYSYYIDSNASLEKDLEKNLRIHERSSGFRHALHSAGPGEVYEIDATGGRIFLLMGNEPNTLIAKPNIYLIIDRWSRYVVSVYVSLRPASWEEARQALLVAFTSRDRRFKTLAVDVNNNRWPPGRVPAVLCPDRGRDFMSDSMEQAVVNDLRIELTPLPPYCPDGKAIVERFIRELKRRMKNSGLKGVYAERPIDPETKRAASIANGAAAHSLSDLYRVLIEIVIDHNTRPHTSLKNRRVLVQNAIPATPQNAYLWGLKNITGLRSPPLSDYDYQRLLLSLDSASISHGVLRYKGRPYKPANEAAFEMIRLLSSKLRSVSIRLDRLDPVDIYVVEPKLPKWAKFQLSPGAAADLNTVTLDEEDALSETSARLWAEAEHEGRRRRVATAKPTTKSAKEKTKDSTNDRKAINAARATETSNLKKNLRGHSNSTKQVSNNKPASQEEWSKIEEQRRLKALEAVRKQRISR